jgi:hypothetical protein
VAQTPDTVDDLQARIAELEAENLSLRAGAPTVPVGVPGPAMPAQPRRRRGLAALAITLIVLGCLLAPVAVVAGWAKITLTDTDRFVATYGPLARDPAVQNYVIDQTMVVINKNVDINQLVGDLIDGIKNLGAGPRADAALEALQGPATSGLQTLLHNAVGSFVRSDAFAQAWTGALRVSHNQFSATMQNDPNAILAVQNDGTIGIQLGPIIAQVKSSLVDRGISVASRIPAVNKTVPIAQASNIGNLQAAYSGVIALGSWLPWVSLLFLVVGVLIVRRSGILIGAGLGFAGAMLLLMIGLAVGRTLLITSLPPNVAPSSITGLLYDTATDPMRATATAGLVLGLLVAIVAWFAGPYRAANSLRGFYGAAVGSLRNWADDHHVSTGRVGEWLYAQRFLTRLIVGLGVAAAIILLRPITVSLIIGTALIALGVLVVLSLVERPPQTVSVVPSAEDVEPTQPIPL